MISRDEVAAIIAPILEEAGAELVEVQVIPGGRRTRLRVFVDREGGITVGECGQLSRRIGRDLDAAPALASGYWLEVSSPGMRRPIWKLEHFRRFVGERLVFELAEAREGRTRFDGTIEAVENERIRLRTGEGALIETDVAGIANAHLDLDPWKRRE